MAIRQRKGRKKPWEVYWNNPFTLKRESLYVETEEEAKKQDALKKFQLKYERDFFRREEAEAPQVEHTFESAYYLFLKDKRFSERSLERHLKNMKRSLAFLKDTPLSDIDNTKLKQLMSHFLSFGIRASTLKRCIGQVFSVIRWAYQNELLRELPRIPKLPHIEYEHFIPPTQQELALVFVHAPEHVRRVVILGSQMGDACRAVRAVWLDVVRCGLGKQGDTPTRRPKEQKRACQGYSNQAIPRGGIEGMARGR